MLLDYPIVATESPRWYSERLTTDMPRDPELASEISRRGRRLEVTHVATMIAVVAASDALGIAPLESLRTEIEAERLVALEVPPEENALLEPATVVPTTMKGRPVPPSATFLIDQLRQRPT